MGKPLDLAYLVGAVTSSPVWGYQLLHTGKWRTDWRGRFGRVGADAAAQRQAQKAGGQRTLLIHAVSVGEVNLIYKLIDHLADAQPDLSVIVSTTTNTGFARATRLYGPHRVVRFPFDFSGAVNRFLDTLKPDAVALTELEVWPNFMQACVKRNIPVSVINGRLSARSFRGYRRLRPVLRKMFASLSAVAAQTQAYADRFIEMGVPGKRVRVLDTMKWDTARIADRVEEADLLAAEIGIDRNRPLIVAGSTGVGEEKMLIDACPAKAQLMLVPRKPERFNEVAALTPGIVRRTMPILDNPAASSGTTGDASIKPGPRRLFLLDTMGELAKAYSLADAVIVGRSFNGWGGSDPIEPVALGKPTIIGPDHHNFAEVVSALESAGGILVTDQPGQAVSKLLTDPKGRAELAKNGREVILSRQGSTEKHAELLTELLSKPTTKH